MADIKVNKEIERKFLLRRLPPKNILNEGKTFFYSTIYIYSGDPELRLREKLDKQSAAVYTMTIKFGEGLVRDEFIVPITESLFKRFFLSMDGGALITKIRYELKVGDLVWEIDDFTDWQGDLFIAEVELRDSRQAVVFPEWLDVEKEITTDPRYFNKNLALTGIPVPR